MGKLVLNGVEYIGGSGSGGGDSSENYSTTEQVVGTWIDGRPLYQKTYYISESWWSTTFKSIDSNFTPAINDQFFVTDMHFTVNDAYMNGSGNVGSAGMEVSCNNNGLGVACVEGVTITEFYITVRYTKVSDL